MQELIETIEIKKDPTNENFYRLEHTVNGVKKHDLSGLRNEMDCLIAMKTIYVGFGNLQKGASYELKLKYVEN